MLKIFTISIKLLLFLIIIPAMTSNAQVVFDFEAGIVFTGYNDVRIPGNQGTFFSLNQDLNANPQIFYRIRANYTINSRHTFSLLFAPLEIKSEGSVPKDILFEGENFPSNTEISAFYKFNSYRLTYRYDIIKKPKLDFGLGFTAKIRDAKIALESSGLKSEKTNVGFVPIINFRLLWRPEENLGILIDGDALAAKQGRAEDVLIAATYRISDRVGLKAGYRILEGGADNDEVYNFALFHYAAFGVFLYL
ncbi:MAG: hypothetical protein JXB19_04590 [Bacteroidales bacterium]|nr:hypothetical protein [Bacteroidales bacterium]